MKKKEKFKILVANGVNLDLLGSREPEIYGKRNLKDLQSFLSAESKRISDLELHFFQTNDEFQFLSKISEKFDGIILNSGAWTHTSLAIADRLRATKTPFIEVHLSNTYSREDFRMRSYTAPHAVGIIVGLGFEGYLAAVQAILSHLKDNRKI